jgi:hypothetical protein
MQYDEDQVGHHFTDVVAVKFDKLTTVQLRKNEFSRRFPRIYRVAKELKSLKVDHKMQHDEE